MSLCKTVSILANEVEKQMNGLQESHIRMLGVMKKMPEYFEKGNLASWEEDYRASMEMDEDENSIQYKAIDLVYELAGLNLFGAYMENESKRIYELVVKELAKLNIVVPKNLNVTHF